MGKLGVPFVNIVDGMAMIKCLTSLLVTSRLETKALLKKGKQLASETEKLLALAQEDLAEQNVCQDESSIIQALERGHSNVHFLFQTWEEDSEEDEG